jgi:hypothetical protein
MRRRKKRVDASVEKPDVGIRMLPDDEKTPFKCVFCGRGCSHAGFTVRDKKAMHIGCLYSEYCRISSLLEEVEKPQNKVLGY